MFVTDLAELWGLGDGVRRQTEADAIQGTVGLIDRIELFCVNGESNWQDAINKESAYIRHTIVC